MKKQRGKNDDQKIEQRRKQLHNEEDDLELFRRAVESFDPTAAKREKGASADQVGGKTSHGKPNQGSKSRVDRGEKHSIDLHRMTGAEARGALAGLFDALIANGAAGSRFEVRVVTGKGLHSGAGGGVLAREAHQFVLARYRREIISISDSPADVAISGVPLRGHFDVTIERTTRKK